MILHYIFISLSISLCYILPQFYDGPTKSSKLISSMCGYQSPNPIFSTGQHLLIEYTGVKIKSSFDFTYVTTDKGLQLIVIIFILLQQSTYFNFYLGRGCGGSIVNYGGVFSSPFYPGTFRNNTQCRWDITVPVGNVPILEFRGIS